jgi:nucleoside-diphosphate-sugar epimerase
MTLSRQVEPNSRMHKTYNQPFCQLTTHTMKILITGATGFIGKALTEYLFQQGGQQLILSSREDFASGAPEIHKVVTGSIDANTEWQPALENTNVVIHTAGIAHQKNIPANKYHLTHVIATKNLALQAINAGVKQFIYLSSVGVHGRTSHSGSFSESSPYEPGNDYATSKLRTEEMLKEVCNNSTMQLTIVRPPLVYAAHAPGNFGRLLHSTYQGIPLPVGGINNKRGIIALENLLDFIKSCIDNPNAMNQTFLVADTDAHLSTQSIIEHLASGMKKPARTLSIPMRLLNIIASLTGQKEKYIQLCGNLAIDTSKAQKLLGWQAPFSTGDMLVKAGRSYPAGNN